MKKGHPETSIMLIEKGADVDSKNFNDDTPLHLASDRGHVEIVVRLIERGASIDSCDKNGNVPLMLSIRKDQTDVAAVLISAGTLIIAYRYSAESVRIKTFMVTKSIY